jgi:hypothetical protein
LVQAINNDTERPPKDDDSDIEMINKNINDSVIDKPTATHQSIVEVDDDEEEASRKMRKIQRGETRGNIQGYRNIAAGQDEAGGEFDTLQNQLQAQLQQAIINQYSSGTSYNKAIR